MSKHLETIGLLSTTPGQKQRVVITAYKPPKGNTKMAYKQLLEMTNSPMIGNRELWILGDLNVNTKNRNTTKYRYMTGFLRKSKLHYLSTGYTHYHPRGASILDHIYTNCDKVSCNGLMNDRFSDHVPVFAVKKQISARRRRKEITGRSYKHYNEARLKEYVLHHDWSALDDANTSGEAYTILLRELTKYLDEYHPIKTFSVPAVKYPTF